MTAAERKLVLIVDDDRDFRRYLEHLVAGLGYETATAADRTELFERLGAVAPSALLLDLQLGDDNGLDVYSELLAAQIQIPVLFLTAYGSINEAVAAIKLGAYDFLTKPPEPEHLRTMLQEAIAAHGKRPLARPARAGGPPSQLVGESAAMQRVRETIAKVASTSASVLVTGESGTGKELVAREVHMLSPRSGLPFVPVNMAALPPTLAESMLFGHSKGSFTGADRAQDGFCHQADRGTLFLDEIGELSLELQPKLLRFLQEQTVQRVGATRCDKVDVRIVAATNRSLQSMIAVGGFREDLFFRLNVVPLQMPPLRQRREDIPLLSDIFLRRAAERSGKAVTGFSPAAMDRMTAYRWPGNVRELQNVIERLVIFSPVEVIDEHAIPLEISSAAVLNQAIDGHAASDVESLARDGRDATLTSTERMEKHLIIDALSRTNGRVGEAANLLGLGQATVYRKIKSYGIDRKRLRRSG